MDKIRILRALVARASQQVTQAGEALHAARVALRAASLTGDAALRARCEEVVDGARDALDEAIDRHNQAAFDLTTAQYSPEMLS